MVAGDARLGPAAIRPVDPRHFAAIDALAERASFSVDK